MLCTEITRIEQWPVTWGSKMQIIFYLLDPWRYSEGYKYQIMSVCHFMFEMKKCFDSAMQSFLFSYTLGQSPDIKHPTTFTQKDTHNTSKHSFHIRVPLKLSCLVCIKSFIILFGGREQCHRLAKLALIFFITFHEMFSLRELVLP